MNPESGGTYQAVCNLTRALTASNIRCEIVTFDSGSSENPNVADLNITTLGRTVTSWQYNKDLVPWLVDNLSRFDAVIVNGIWLHHVYGVRKVIKQLRLRSTGSAIENRMKIPDIYIMPHGMLDPYFQAAGTRKLKAIRNRLYWKLIESKNINEAAALLFTCETEKVLARQTFRNYKPQLEITVGMGINRPPAYHTKMQEAFLFKAPDLNRSPYLLYLSRIDPKKGLDILIKAYTLISKKIKQIDALSEIPKLVIAGPGIDSEYGKSILDFVRNAGISSQIIFTGMLEGDAKWGAIYGADAFVLTSHQENFGIAVVEALSCSKPVLISDQINIYKEIEMEDAGFVCSIDTVEGVSSMLHRWIKSNADDKTKMSSNSLKCFEKYFMIDAVAKNFMSAVKKRSPSTLVNQHA